MIERPELLVADATSWRAWLTEHHAESDGVRLVLGRKDAIRSGSAPTTLTYAQALDEALCFGWIDGQGSRRDEVSYLVRMTPRRPRSRWSARNVEHVARLEREQRMTEAGRAAVRAAQADGRWSSAYGTTAVEVPPDLAAALAGEPRAQAMFDVLTRSNLLAVVDHVTTAVRPETRQRRVARLVGMLARGEAPFPQRRRPEPPAP